MGCDFDVIERGRERSVRPHVGYPPPQPPFMPPPRFRNRTGSGGQRRVGCILPTMFQIGRLMGRNELDDARPQPTRRIQISGPTALEFFAPSCSRLGIDLTGMGLADHRGQIAGYLHCFFLADFLDLNLQILRQQLAQKYAAIEEPRGQPTLPERGREVARPLCPPYGIIAWHCSIVVPRCRGLDCLLNVDQAEAAVFPRMPADATQYGHAHPPKRAAPLYPIRAIQHLAAGAIFAAPQRGNEPADILSREKPLYLGALIRVERPEVLA